VIPAKVSSAPMRAQTVLPVEVGVFPQRRHSADTMSKPAGQPPSGRSRRTAKVGLLSDSATTTSSAVPSRRISKPLRVYDSAFSAKTVVTVLATAILSRIDHAARWSRTNINAEFTLYACGPNCSRARWR
jgi:hypothetical protein